MNPDYAGNLYEYSISARIGCEELFSRVSSRTTTSHREALDSYLSGAVQHNAEYLVTNISTGQSALFRVEFRPTVEQV